MKSICIAGRLGKDAELRRTQSGDPVLSFNVAVDDGFGQSKRTLWFKCSLWGKRGQSLEEHLRKGSAVTVSGDLSTEEYQGKTQLIVRVNDVTMQGGSQGQSSNRTSYGAPDNSRSVADDLSDEIPFAPELR